MISFNQIPIDLRTPGAYLEFDNSAAVRGLPGMPSRILVIGQKLAAGTQPALTPVQILDEAAAEAAFGRGSMAHLQFRALKAANTWTESWAIALDDDVAAAPAAGSILFGGALGAAGTINLYIAGQRVRIGVGAADTPAAVATATAAAINAATDLPVTAAVNAVTLAQVDITARGAGAAGNDIDLRVNYNFGEALPTGLTAVITAMAGGATNPDIAGAIAAFGDAWYTDIAMPYTDAANLTALESELARRAGPLVMMDGHAYAAATGTHAALTTLGNARNSEHLTIIAATGSPSAPWAWSAALCAVAAFHIRIDPARPLQTLALAGVMAPDAGQRFTLEERNLLLFDGVSTFRVDDGGRVLIERAITTYETNAAGIADPSYLDLTTIKTLAYLRYSVRARIVSKFPRHKLASDGTEYGAGQAIVTPSVIRAELIALFKDWENAGLAEGMAQFKADLVVERDAGDVNRVNALIPPDVVNQFRVFAGKVQFRL
ncbi:phage tail sheath subtilisin-like domain-containing protein [Varunaivibrio sulfuroxidans]|uniref:Phage tail sheath gpL-like n=1 Tax=Varunaivibrio sulfuroxidans TaxID=1773489 RepID=A0A4R3JBV4_9PROT|nr:phage tail sheath subtilisin-like domain-containing protein [Varunaivibrio sulfuroxidans]TCS62586.1 phage tail sheath gpL-like [Varunaivibrio sulfuroxidans]WES30745.1 phage tail sheath subtilisin-like domain-containing protein [Varunaivibrio sulfuroxidans]